MAVLVPRRSDADRWNAAFERALARLARSGPIEPAQPADLLGLEHEFRVLVDGRAIDFGRSIHRLPIPGRRLDPADPNAYRGTWGGTITADGAEAEIAVAPVARGPGCTAELLARARLGRSMLGAALPPGAVLEGFSTHLSVAVPRGLEERAARIYARTFAPALMLLLDGPESPGLLVRPRPGRLELGGEFVDGGRLAAAAAFAAGSVRVAARVARRRPFAGRTLPPEIRADVHPARGRFGWFVGRDAFGADLYRGGRSTPLRLRRGGTVLAGDHLARCWTIARAAIAAAVAEEDLATADRLVAGVAALGVEGSQAEAIAFESVSSGPITAPAADGAGTPFGAAIVERFRPGFRVTPEIVSWEFVVLRLDDGHRRGYACLPRRLLGAGLGALDAGHLDHLLRGYLAAAAGPTPRLLASVRQTAAAGLYTSVGRAADLLAPEPSPLGGGPGKRRPDRRPDEDREPPEQPSSGSPSTAARAVGVSAGAAAGIRLFGLPVAAAAAAIGGVAIVAVVVGALLLGGPGSAPASTGAPSATASATRDFSALAAAYLDFSERLSAAQATANAAIDAITNDDEARAAYSDAKAVYETAVADLRALDFPPELYVARDKFIAALEIAIGVFEQLIDDPTSTDPTIDENVALVETQTHEAAAAIRAFLGLPPPDGTASDSCMSQADFDLVRRAWEPETLSQADRDRILAILGAYDFGSDPTATDWRDELMAAVEAGTDPGPQFAAELVAGVVHITICGGDVTGPGPGGSAPAGSEASPFSSGSATLVLGGEATGAEDLTLDPSFVSGDPTLRNLTYFSVNAQGTLQLDLPEPLGPGTYSTLADEAGLYFAIENADIGFGPESYATGLGLGYPQSGPEIYCTFTIEATSTGGISGTIDCPNVNDPTLVMSLTGSFSAEP